MILCAGVDPSATGCRQKLWMLKVYIASGRVDKLMEIN